MTTADAVVIGGGATGASILFHLAQSGMRRCLLLERSTFASGPTGRSPGIVRQHYASQLLVRLAKYSLAMFARWADAVGTPCDFTQAGLYGAADTRNAAALRRTVATQVGEGVRVEFIDPTDLGEPFPGIEHRDFVTAFHEADAGFCDPSQAAIGLIDAARRLGARAQQMTGACRIAVTDHAVTGVATTAGFVSTPVVVLAAGPWSAALAARIGVQLPIRVTRHSIWAFRNTAAAVPLGGMLADLASGMYLRPDADRLCLLGSLRASDGIAVDDPDRFDEGVGFEDTFAIGERFARRLPSWRDAESLGGWSSLYDESPDGDPILGPVAGLEGLHVAVGLSGHGFKLCPAIGRWIADGITGSASPWPAAPLALERFSPAVGAPAPTYVFD